MRKLKFVFVFAAVSMLTTTIHAQTKTLIKESNDERTYEKKWRVEWGALTGAGVNYVFKQPNLTAVANPEGMSYTAINYAPRPEAELGFFTEVGKVGSIFSVSTEFTYTMRAVPQPVFSNNSNQVAEYKNTYLNGATFGLLFNFKPVDKFKVGIGFDCTRFLMTKKIQESNHAKYTQAFSTPFGLKTVFSYQVSPRMDIQMYARLGKIGDCEAQNMNGGSSNTSAMWEKMKPEDISAGVRVAYRICGKELHIKKKLQGEKKVYRLNY